MYVQHILKIKLSYIIILFRNVQYANLEYTLYNLHTYGLDHVACYVILSRSSV